MGPNYTEISRDALWSNNTGLVQLLGLCPLLAITTTTINGIGLGLATTFVILLSSTIASLLRPLLRPETRIAVFVLIIATLVSVVDMSMQAWFYDLHRTLGIFVPLIVTNCAIVARAETFASRHDPLRAATDGFMTGVGFTLVLVTMGAIRELVGQGTILAQAEMLFGENTKNLTLRLFDDGFLLATLPPGAFITLGLLFALRNVLADRQTSQLVTAAEAKPGQGPA